MPLAGPAHRRPRPPKEHKTYLGASPAKKSEGELTVGGDHKIDPHGSPGWTGLQAPH